MFPAQTYAAAQAIERIPGDEPTLDGYARRGVIITRDAASLVMAALRRDAFEMRERGGSANLEAAATNDALADSILKAVNA